MVDRWVKRWNVKGSNENIWVVAIDKEGNYACSCPQWKFRRIECHHIKFIKLNGGKEEEDRRPGYALAKVRKPIFKKKENKLLIPLIAIPDVCMMEATICYYMIKYGYSMSEIRDIRRIPRDWTGEKIINYVENYGEAEYPKDWYKH